MLKWLYLALGGTLGTVARYFMGSVTHRFLGTQFPFGTMAVNLIGCLLIGFFSAVGSGRILAGTSERLFLMTGFCGAFTTFSAFILESSELMNKGNSTNAFLYVILSVALGYFFFLLGVQIAQRI